MTNFDDNYIDRYLLNQLKGSDKKNFDDKLKVDTMLQTKVKSQMKIMQAVQKVARANVKMQIGNITKEWEQYVPELKIGSFVAKQGEMLNKGIEAIKEEFIDLINQFFRPYSVSLRKASTAALTTEEKAFDLYRKKEFEQAITLLKQLPAENIEAKLMLGNALLITENFEQALEQFNIIIEAKPIGYANEAQWYAGLTLLQLNRPIEAKAYFQNISTDKYANKKMKNNAVEIIKQIDKIVK